MLLSKLGSNNKNVNKSLSNMKVTREKRVKRNLKYYKYNFGFREPYQILIDNTFITAALNVSR